jgi:hypothetical protein
MPIKKRQKPIIPLTDDALLSIMNDCIERLKECGGEDLVAAVTIRRGDQAYTVAQCGDYDAAIAAMQSITAKAKHVRPGTL